MNWKEFLKPDFKKIILFVGILLIQILWVVIKIMNPPELGSTGWHGLEIIIFLPAIFISLIYGHTSEYMANPSLASSYGTDPFTIAFLILIAIVVLFVLYLIVCFMVYVFKKYYKKIQ